MKFSHYVIRRFGMTVMTLVGILSITFVLSRIIPADPIGAILGPQVPPELLEKISHDHGFDKPLYTQFFIYWKNILHGNLGISLRTQRPVFEDLCTFFPATIELATIALLLGTVTGIPLGIFSAVKKMAGRSFLPACFIVRTFDAGFLVGPYGVAGFLLLAGMAAWSRSTESISFS